MIDHKTAVEAGAKAAYLHALETARAHGDPATIEGILDVLGRTWEEVSDERREHYRAVAGHVITAYKRARRDK